MPTYDYQCRSCGAVTEVIHSMIEEGPTACERCGGELRRILYPAGIIFKGSGFYRTDSRSRSSTAKSADASKAGSDSGSASGSPAKPSSDRSGPDGGGSSGSETEKG